MTRHVGIARMHPGARMALERVLDAHEDKGEREKALAALRQEIAGFDARVEKERARASVKVDAAKDPHARPGNANARKEENAGENFPPEKRERKTGANSPERIIARLKRDAATDTLAAALLGSIEAGDTPPAWPSSAPWCPLARLPLPMPLPRTPRGSEGD